MKTAQSFLKPCPICGCWFCQCKPTGSLKAIERMMRMDYQRVKSSANRYPFKHFQAALNDQRNKERKPCSKPA